MNNDEIGTSYHVKLKNIYKIKKIKTSYYYIPYQAQCKY